MPQVYGPNITNLRLTPITLPDVSVLGGRVRGACGTIALGTGDFDDDDIIHLERIPTNAVIVSIKLWSDDLDGSTGLVFDVGVYDNADTPAVKDRDAFATLLTAFQSVTTGLEVLAEVTPENIAKRLWQYAGDTTDPGGYYHISITIETVASSAQAGDVSWVIQYMID